MKLTKCVNGHFYDEEKFGTCPHCAGTSKLNASSIFGQSSAEKPAAEEPEFVDAPKETGFTAPPEEPEFVDAPKETGFTAPPEEPEFVDAPKETGFTAPPEEPEFSPAPEAASVDEEAAFDINSQPSFDTPLDFDSDFAAPPVAEETDSEEEAKEEEEEFELLSKYSSDAPSEEAQETSVATDAEAPAWEMPPNVEEIKTGDEEAVESVADPELEEQPTEIVEEAGADLMNGLLSEEEMAGNTSQPESPEEPEAPAFSPESEAPAFSPIPEVPEFSPAPEAPAFSPEPEAPAFSPEPEAPAFSPVPEAPAFSPVPEVPAFSPEPEAPAFSPAPEIPEFSPVPEAPAFSAEPANPAFVPEQPAAFDLPSDEDDDDDGHTVAFYDDIFNEVSKTAVTAAEPAIAAEASAQDAFTEAANAAAEVAMNAVPAANADAAADAVEEPNVFTAPPLPKVQNLPTPCVGWLIALNGAHIGQDFHLRVGKNYVGRDESMDVALTGDKSVSRHKHAIIIYEPKQHKYFVQPGESNELIYVNDEVVLLPMELKPYDLLVIGDIELWFMPLCDAEHNWSEIIRKLQEQMQ